MAGYVIGMHALRPDAALIRNESRRWAQGLARGWGVTVEVRGLERLPIGQRTVLMANHQSHADVVALLVALPEIPVFLAKRELRRVPLFGRAMQDCGHIFIDRGRQQQSRRTIDDAASQLRAGHPLLVFPEGTRGRRDEVAPFKKGGFHLARQADVAIVPIGIRGSRAVWPRDQAAALPGVIELQIGDPVPADEVAAMPLDDLIAKVRGDIQRLSGLPPSDVQTPRPRGTDRAAR